MTKKTLHVYALVVLITLAVGFSAPHSALGQGVETTGGIGVPPLQKSQSGFTPIVNIPGIPLNADSSIPEILNGLFRLSIVAAGLLAVIYITIGGFEYMVSGAREAKKDGRERIQSAVIGLLLLLSSYIILYVINPDILNLDPFRTTLTPATEQQGPAAPSGGANTGGGSGTPQTPQTGGGTSALPPRWKSEVDAQSLSELKRNYSLTCTNPESPFYQGAAKCQYIQDRIVSLDENAQDADTPTIGRPKGGWHGAYDQYGSKRDVEAAAAACRADGRTPYTYASPLGGESCKETLFGPYVAKTDASGTIVNPGANIDCGYRFTCKK